MEKTFITFVFAAIPCLSGRDICDFLQIYLVIIKASTTKN